MTTRTSSRSAASHLGLLHRLAQDFRPSADLAAAAHPVLRALVEHAGFCGAVLVVYDRDSSELRIEDIFGALPVESSRGAFDSGRTAVGRAFRLGRPEVQRAPVPVEPGRAPRSRARAVAPLVRPQRVTLCVPLRGSSEVRGVLVGERDEPVDYDPLHELALIEVLAALLRPALVLADAAAESEGVGSRGAALDPSHVPGVGEVIGRSKPMLAVFEAVHQVAATSTTVLLLGESGTGKELIARGLHTASARAKGPMVAVNCGALPESLVESELFGYEKGAFTGAVHQRRGRFELADGGTLFLDEVGELTPMAQVRLLRALQEREIERVGGSTPVRVDVRVIAATSRDLKQMVDEGRFRLDLYYRLAVFPILLPPLRDRGGDIVLLADHFVARYNRLHLRQVRRIATSALDMLTRYHWPGNVRELENAVERAVLLSTDDVIHGHHLPPSLQTAEATGTQVGGPLEAQVAQFERNLVLDALKSANGNMAAAARALGVTERIMGLRVKAYGIDPFRFRASARG